MGTSQVYPVIILHIPAKKSAGERKIERWRDKAVKRGMNVPKSPRDPLISAKVRSMYSFLVRL